MNTLIQMKHNTVQFISRCNNNQRLLLLVAFAVCYTVFRYLIFGHVSLSHLPSYLLNKMVSMLSVLTLAVTAWSYYKKDTEAVKHWGRISLHFVVLHILFSMILLNSAYYPKFFSEGKLSLKGEVIMLFGVLATYCYWRLNNPKSAMNKNKLHLLQLLAAVFVGAHLFFMGYAGWLTPWKWYGGMPPISLLSFALSMFAFYSLFMVGKQTDKQA